MQLFKTFQLQGKTSMVTFVSGMSMDGRRGNQTGGTETGIETGTVTGRETGPKEKRVRETDATTLTGKHHLSVKA